MESILNIIKYIPEIFFYTYKIEIFLSIHQIFLVCTKAPHEHPLSVNQIIFTILTFDF